MPFYKKIITKIKTVNNMIDDRFCQSKYFQSSIFFAMCDFFKISQEKGQEYAKTKKETTEIYNYFQNLNNFTEESIHIGWSLDKFRVFRNWYSNRRYDFKKLIQIMNIKEKQSVIDYGCSVSSFANYAMNNQMNIDLTLADIPSPHFDFCKYYYKNFVKDFIDIHPNKFPLKNYYDKIILLDVLEHIVSPLELIIHLTNHLNNGGRLIETFIYLDNVEKNRSNLESAIKERDLTFKYLKENMRLVSGKLGVFSGPRVWEKK